METMDLAVKGMETAKDFYVKDLEAMTDEQVLGSAGGSARKAVDFSYELGFINLQVAARLRGEEPPKSPDGDEWMVAPPELQTKSAITEYVGTACQAIIDAAKAIPEDEIGKLIGSPGRERPTYAQVNFAWMHTMYHDAQLNFIQSLGGDTAMHWF
jgi:hypothetical protein